MPQDLPEGGSIKIGFPWNQAFDFPAGFLEADDALRMEFRQSADSNVVLASLATPGGIVIESARVFVSLTGAQTKIFPPGFVLTSFALTRDGTEYALSQRISIKVEKMPTRAAE